jgi:hypothetical protein
MSRFLAVNENYIDRSIRVLIGIGLLSLTLFGPRTWWGLIGFVPLVTGLAGICPLYALLGISTWKPRVTPVSSPSRESH